MENWQKKLWYLKYAHPMYCLPRVARAWWTQKRRGIYRPYAVRAGRTARASRRERPPPASAPLGCSSANYHTPEKKRKEKCSVVLARTKEYSNGDTKAETFNVLPQKHDRRVQFRFFRGCRAKTTYRTPEQNTKLVENGEHSRYTVEAPCTQRVTTKKHSSGNTKARRYVRPKPSTKERFQLLCSIQFDIKKKYVTPWYHTQYTKKLQIKKLHC